ncbi:hypothetical protein [Enterococcus pallens]|uniref:Uncharacterized protein n=1 Tax=Enterococcus pallens ATCC BAA-351 TaxID=1158607 RepID=R2SDP3_9ENTE|nr:hypothetical protein [Enterococcus pallens]EOH86274.1 hypothetical protein UAU_05295 [Enterococcus pallens ATCC BAA-351]EOU09402.1 hypothetical protein I588_05248 [Enterococcus pallens ATCC BAA-351]
MKVSFTQHEVEIISSHLSLAKEKTKASVAQEVENMVSLLQSEQGKQYIEDDEQRAYTLDQYKSTAEKLAEVTEDEFQKIDLSSADMLR